MKVDNNKYLRVIIIMLKYIRLSLKNKVVWYILTRYATYGIQFVVSLLCAAKMGPYYFGIWGFVLLLLNYMQQINLGIPHSANILLVQERNNPHSFAVYESTSFYAQGILCVGVAVFAIVNMIWEYPFLNKYSIGWLFYVVCFIAMAAYMVQICTTIYRIKHKLLEIAISQSIVPLLMLLSLFSASGKDLVRWFTLAYLIGFSFSLLLFFLRGKISLKGRPNSNSFYNIYSKGFFLFVFNACFCLIIISTRTVVSSEYTVSEFGYFTFAYTLADAVILLLAAISFLLFPKSIEKLHTSNLTQVKNTIELLRINYMTFTHGLMYIAFFVFPIITRFIPKYLPALPAIYMMALALIMNTMVCGYSDYLMAQNKEKILASVSFLSLVVNILLALIFAIMIKCTFEYIIIATIISYFFFSLTCVYLGLKHMGSSISAVCVITECFPLRLLIPFLISVLFIILWNFWLLPLPFLSFVI